jgi:RNA polymerase sigma factor for flagellar operon FliA
MNTTQELVLKYVPLANKMAYQKKKSLPKFVDVEDLKSAAYLGLVEAANRFNPNLGIAFTTFAYPRIFGAIHDYLREQGWFKRGDSTPMMSLDSSSDDKEYALKDLISSKIDSKIDESLEVVTLDFDDQAKDIFKHYFVEEYSMKEVGDMIGLSESRVSQLIKLYKGKIKEKWSRPLLIEELAA